MSRDRLRADDGGFSIAELLVAIVVGLLVLGAGYLIMETGLKSFRNIENATAQARDAAHALDTLQRDLREGTGITQADPYDLTFMSDADDNGIIERWHFYVESGSTLLKRDRIDPNTNTVVKSDVLARLVRNRVTGVPLFTYYSEPGASLTGTMTVEAHVVHTRIITQRQVTPYSPPYRADVDVFLRNVPTK